MKHQSPIVVVGADKKGIKPSDSRHNSFSVCTTRLRSKNMKKRIASSVKRSLSGKNVSKLSSATTTRKRRRGVGGDRSIRDAPEGAVAITPSSCNSASKDGSISNEYVGASTAKTAETICTTEENVNDIDTLITNVESTCIEIDKLIDDITKGDENISADTSTDNSVTVGATKSKPDPSDKALVAPPRTIGELQQQPSPSDIHREELFQSPIDILADLDVTLDKQGKILVNDSLLLRHVNVNDYDKKIDPNFKKLSHEELITIAKGLSSDYLQATEEVNRKNVKLQEKDRNIIMFVKELNSKKKEVSTLRETNNNLVESNEREYNKKEKEITTLRRIIMFLVMIFITISATYIVTMDISNDNDADSNDNKHKNTTKQLLHFKSKEETLTREKKKLEYQLSIERQKNAGRERMALSIQDQLEQQRKNSSKSMKLLKSDLSNEKSKNMILEKAIASLNDKQTTTEKKLHNITSILENERIEWSIRLTEDTSIRSGNNKLQHQLSIEKIKMNNLESVLISTKEELAIVREELYNARTSIKILKSTIKDKSNKIISLAKEIMRQEEENNDDNSNEKSAIAIVRSKKRQQDEQHHYQHLRKPLSFLDRIMRQGILKKLMSLYDNNWLTFLLIIGMI